MMSSFREFYNAGGVIPRNYTPTGASHTHPLLKPFQCIQISPANHVSALWVSRPLMGHKERTYEGEGNMVVEETPPVRQYISLVAFFITTRDL